MYWVACYWCGAGWEEKTSSLVDLERVDCPRNCFSHKERKLYYVKTGGDKGEFGHCTFCGKLGFLKRYTQFIFVDVPLCNGCYAKHPLEHLGFEFPKSDVTLHIEWYESSEFR